MVLREVVNTKMGILRAGRKKGSFFDSHAQKSMGDMLELTNNDATVVCWLGLDGGIQNLGCIIVY